MTTEVAADTAAEQNEQAPAEAHEENQAVADDGDVPSWDDFLRAEGKLSDSADDTGEQEAGAADDTVDDEDQESVEAEVPEDPKAKKAPPRSEDRIVVRLQRAEERVQALEQENRQLKSQPQAPGFRPTGNLMDDVMLLTEHYGAKDRSSQRPLLNQLGIDMLAELDSDDQSPAVIASRNRRAADAKHREVQRQIDELKKMNEEKDATIAAREAVGIVSQNLKALNGDAEYPYLYAVEDDVPNAVYRGVLILCHEGGYRITDQQSALDACHYVAKQLDDQERRRAERLEPLRGGQKSEVAPNHPSRETRGAQKDGPSGRSRGEDRGRPKTVTASGNGNRQPPAPVTNKTPDELWRETLEEDRQERQRNAARRTGR